MTLPYERPLVATARRIRDERVELGCDEPPAKDPWIGDLLAAGFVRVVFTAPSKRQPDRWALTDAGSVWLAGAPT